MSDDQHAEYAPACTADPAGAAYPPNYRCVLVGPHHFHDFRAQDPSPDHAFKPGTTTDNDPPSDLWCDVCGESRAKAHPELNDGGESDT